MIRRQIPVWIGFDLDEDDERELAVRYEADVAEDGSVREVRLVEMEETSPASGRTRIVKAEELISNEISLIKSVCSVDAWKAHHA